MASLPFIRRVGVQILLGFSSGLPITLCGSTLQAWLSVSNISLVTIGFATLLAQPYAYKFLWAPFLDQYCPPFLGKRRGWILITQVLLILLLIFIAFQNPEQHLKIILGSALLLAFISASQDTAIDGYRTEILEDHERGLGASFFTLGYRVGLMISGGLALGLAEFWGWKNTYLCMSGLLLIGVLGNCFAIEPPQTKTVVSTISFWSPFLQLFKRFSPKTCFSLFLFILFYKLGDALVLSLSSTFLLQDLHFSLSDVGFANKTMGIFMSIVGALFGGLLLTRIPLFQALLGFGLLQALSTLGFWFLSYAHPSFFMMISIIGIDQFCSGLGNVAFIALLMKLCDREYSATQYAVLSAIAALGRIYVGPLAALLVNAFGWESFYLTSFWLSFPGLMILFLLPKNFGSAAK